MDPEKELNQAKEHAENAKGMFMRNWKVAVGVVVVMVFIAAFVFAG